MFYHKQIIKSLFLVIILVILTGCAKVRTPPGSEATSKTASIEISSINPVDKNHIEIYFNTSISSSEAVNKNNYFLSKENGEIIKIKDIIQNRGDVITIITESLEDTKYQIVIINLKDEEGRKQRNTIKHSFKGTDKEDDTNPAIVNSYPVDNGEDIGILTPIQLIFNDYIDSNTISGAITIEDDLGNDIDFSIEHNGARIVIIPDLWFDYSTKYRLTISSSISDIAGNPLKNMNEIEFFTVSDDESASIKGRVDVDNFNIDPQNCYVVLSSSPDYKLSEGIIYARKQVNDNFEFDFNGVSPNGKEIPQYYLYSSIDDNNDGIIDYAGLNYDGYPVMLSIISGALRDDIKLKLTKIDNTPPVITDIRVKPEHYYGGLLKVYLTAEEESHSGSKVELIEMFIEQIGSYNTGIKLFPDVGDYGFTDVIDASVILSKPGEYNWCDDTLTLYFHTSDTEGNWSAFKEITVEKFDIDKKETTIEGTVFMEMLPVENSFIEISGNNELLAITQTNSDGYFKQKVPYNDNYKILSFLDVDGNNHFDGGEPSGVIEWDGFGEIVIDLSYKPDITYANAFLDHRKTSETNDSWVLTIKALVSDDDFDLESVYAELLDGEVIELNDEGINGDRTENDGIYTYEANVDKKWVDKHNDESPIIISKDTAGNITSADINNYPGLNLHNTQLINNISTTDIEKQIRVEIYTQDFSENYKWVCFILDKDYQNFEDLVKYSLWNNMDNPISGEILKINRDSIKGYWGYPSGFEFWIYIVVYEDEGMKLKESDRSISQFIFIRK